MSDTDGIDIKKINSWNFTIQLLPLFSRDNDPFEEINELDIEGTTPETFISGIDVGDTVKAIGVGRLKFSHIKWTFTVYLLPLQFVIVPFQINIKVLFWTFGCFSKNK